MGGCLHVNITTPWEVDLDGRREERDGFVAIEYVGKARRQLDGTYRVLAKLYGALRRERSRSCC